MHNTSSMDFPRAAYEFIASCTRSLGYMHEWHDGTRQYYQYLVWLTYLKCPISKIVTNEYTTVRIEMHSLSETKAWPLIQWHQTLNKPNEQLLKTTQSIWKYLLLCLRFVDQVHDTYRIPTGKQAFVSDTELKTAMKLSNKTMVSSIERAQLR